MADNTNTNMNTQSSTGSQQTRSSYAPPPGSQQTKPASGYGAPAPTTYGGSGRTAQPGVITTGTTPKPQQTKQAPAPKPGEPGYHSVGGDQGIVGRNIADVKQNISQTSRNLAFRDQPNPFAPQHTVTDTAISIAPKVQGSIRPRTYSIDEITGRKPIGIDVTNVRNVGELRNIPQYLAQTGSPAYKIELREASKIPFYQRLEAQAKNQDLYLQGLDANVRNIADFFNPPTDKLTFNKIVGGKNKDVPSKTFFGYDPEVQKAKEDFTVQTARAIKNPPPAFELSKTPMEDIKNLRFPARGYLVESPFTAAIPYGAGAKALSYGGKAVLTGLELKTLGSLPKVSKAFGVSSRIVDPALTVIGLGLVGYDIATSKDVYQAISKGAGYVALTPSFVAGFEGTGRIGQAVSDVPGRFPGFLSAKAAMISERVSPQTAEFIKGKTPDVIKESIYKAKQTIQNQIESIPTYTGGVIKTGQRGESPISQSGLTTKGIEKYSANIALIESLKTTPEIRNAPGLDFTKVRQISKTGKQIEQIFQEEIAKGHDITIGGSAAAEAQIGGFNPEDLDVRIRNENAAYKKYLTQKIEKVMRPVYGDELSIAYGADKVGINVKGGHAIEIMPGEEIGSRILGTKATVPKPINIKGIQYEPLFSQLLPKNIRSQLEIVPSKDVITASRELITKGTSYASKENVRRIAKQYTTLPIENVQNVIRPAVHRGVKDIYRGEIFIEAALKQQKELGRSTKNIEKIMKTRESLKYYSGIPIDTYAEDIIRKGGSYGYGVVKQSKVKPVILPSSGYPSVTRRTTTVYPGVKAPKGIAPIITYPSTYPGATKAKPIPITPSSYPSGYPTGTPTKTLMTAATRLTQPISTEAITQQNTIFGGGIYFPTFEGKQKKRKLSPAFRGYLKTYKLGGAENIFATIGKSVKSKGVFAMAEKYRKKKKARL